MDDGAVPRKLSRTAFNNLRQKSGIITKFNLWLLFISTFKE